MDKFQNKYRISSARCSNWDYRWRGAYFITICTQNREYFFGEIINEQMQLSPIGLIAATLWYQIPNHSKNIDLGAFIVLPNHIHGILIILENDIEKTINNADVETGHSVETGHALSLRTLNHNIGKSRFQNIGKNSISSIVGSFKSAVSKHAHRKGFDFQWQTRFHDHIIRTEESFQKITEYVKNNPLNWQKDNFFNS